MTIVAIILIVVVGYLIWKFLCALGAFIVSILPIIGIVLLVGIGIAVISGIVWLFMPYKGRDDEEGLGKTKLPKSCSRKLQIAQKDNNESKDDMIEFFKQLPVDFGEELRSLGTVATIEKIASTILVHLDATLSDGSCYVIRQAIEESGYACTVLEAGRMLSVEV